jgi:hypothetical protein
MATWRWMVMNMYDAAVADMVDAMYEYRRVGAHCMRYVEFVRHPTAGSLALFCSSAVAPVIRCTCTDNDMPMDWWISNDISTCRNHMTNGKYYYGFISIELRSNLIFLEENIAVSIITSHQTHCPRCLSFHFTAMHAIESKWSVTALSTM